VKQTELVCCVSLLTAALATLAPAPAPVPAPVPASLSPVPVPLGPALLAAERTLAPTATPTPTPLPPSDREPLRDTIARVVRDSGVTGAAVAVVDGSGTWVAGFGQARREAGRPMDGDTLFRVGSLTKPFLSLAILRLVAAGRLRLSDRVRDLAPEIAVENRWERTDPLRVAHLLEHTSGFDEMRFNEIFDSDSRQDRPLREVLAVNPRSRVARWPPGSRFSYSQPGYTLAGYIVEKVSGMPFERFMEQEVFAPLGVRGAALRLTPDARARLATGYQDGQAVDQVLLLHRPAGNLMISAAGLARLIELQLGRGHIGGQRFLPAESIERMERCETRWHGVAPICYGLANWGDVSTPVPMRSHGGFMPGYLSFYQYAPTRGFGFAVLINQSDERPDAYRVGNAILRHLLGDEWATPRPAPTPVADPGRYLGHYRLASPTIEFLRYKSDVFSGMNVALAGGQLFLHTPWGERIPMLATAVDRFRFPRDYDHIIRFDSTPQGKRILVVNNDTYEQESAIWAGLRRLALQLALQLLGTATGVPLLLLLVRHRERSPVLRPALLAAASLLVMMVAFDLARRTGRLGYPNPATLLVWISSWLFALSAHSGLRRSLRSLRDPATPAWLRAYALLLSAAAVWLALHLSRYGLIGLRTWRW
jgi:CubicO group peptidase (beta-lactamase class C family)